MKLNDEELRRVACSMDAQDTVELLRVACALSEDIKGCAWAFSDDPYLGVNMGNVAGLRNLLRLFLPDDWKESP